MYDPIQIATSKFDQGFSCSQSLFSAFALQFGVSDEIASRIASPFGGGIARQGETCGAVTGALMALSLKFGPRMGESNDGIYHISQEFLHRFQQQNTYLQCRQLINFDLSQPGDLEEARRYQVFDKVCPILVRSAAEIVLSMLASDEQPI